MKYNYKLIERNDYYYFLDGSVWGKKQKKSANLENVKNSSIFVPKITEDEIRNVISGENSGGNDDTVKAASRYLRRSQSTGSSVGESKPNKRQEEKLLKAYISQNNLWLSENEFPVYLKEGAEQKVYFSDNDYVLKANNSIFYSSWIDYFSSLLLHNYFFTDTLYQLMGFVERDNSLLAVVKQPFIKSTEDTDLSVVMKFMTDNGFVNTKNNDYINYELGIIIEDLHEENVITEDGVLYFVDTVFYTKYSNPERFEKGGEVSVAEKLGVSEKETKNIFHLPYEFTVYVPSTKGVSENISEKEFKERIKEVETKLANLFGGFSATNIQGGYMSTHEELVKEKIVKVTSYCTAEAFNKNKIKLLQQISDWSREWGQEAIGLEFEGDLMYVPQKLEKGGTVSATGFEIYHQTLSSALVEAETFAKNKGYQLGDYFPDIRIGGVSYEETKRTQLELLRGGKEVNQLAIQIYRMPSGTYELNCYFTRTLPVDKFQVEVNSVEDEMKQMEDDIAVHKMQEGGDVSNIHYSYKFQNGQHRIIKTGYSPITYLGVHSVEDSKEIADEKIKRLNNKGVKLENGGSVSKFTIPKEIQHLYKIEGDFSNIDEWSGEIVNYFSVEHFNDHYRKGKTGEQIKEDESRIGYVMISLDSNNIIPITRYDEHQTGYEALDEYYYDKYHVKQENYISIFVLGHQIFYYPNRYDNNRIGYEDHIKAMQKYIEYGGDKNNEIVIADHTGNDDNNSAMMTAEEFIKYNGEIKEAIAQSRDVSYFGNKLIEDLTEISDMFSQYHLEPIKQNEKYIRRLYEKCDNFAFLLSNLKNNLPKSTNTILSKSYDKLSDLLYKNKDKDITPAIIEQIEQAMFSFSGVKNVLHINLKQGNKDLAKIFFNNDEALKLFNQIDKGGQPVKIDNAVKEPETFLEFYERMKAKQSKVKYVEFIKNPPKVLYREVVYYRKGYITEEWNYQWGSRLTFGVVYKLKNSSRQYPIARAYRMFNDGEFLAEKYEKPIAKESVQVEIKKDESYDKYYDKWMSELQGVANKTNKTFYLFDYIREEIIRDKKHFEKIISKKKVRSISFSNDANLSSYKRQEGFNLLKTFTPEVKAVEEQADTLEMMLSDYKIMLKYAKTDKQKEDVMSMIESVAIMKKMRDKKNANTESKSELNKILLHEFADAIVYTVNGEYVRKEEFPRWRMGGHWYVGEEYRFIPKGIVPKGKDEIWIDNNLLEKPVDLKTTTGHELIEFKLMKYLGMSYDKSHDFASAFEIKLRSIGVELEWSEIEEAVNAYFEKIKSENIKSANKEDLKQASKKITDKAELNKTELYKFSDVTVNTVNGEYVREKHNIDFTNDANHYLSEKYEFIPKDEIWVDEIMVDKPTDLKASVTHQLLFVKLTRDSKMSYDRAEEHASALESKVRMIGVNLDWSEIEELVGVELNKINSNKTSKSKELKPYVELKANVTHDDDFKSKYGFSVDDLEKEYNLLKSKGMQSGSLKNDTWNTIAVMFGKTKGASFHSPELNDEAYSDYLKYFAEGVLPSKLPNKNDLFASTDLHVTEIDVKPIVQNIVKIKQTTTEKSKSLSNIVGNDDLRPVMSGVYHDAENKCLVATDAHKLVVIPDNSIKVSEIRTVDNSKKLQIPKNTYTDKYPNYRGVIPFDNPIKVNSVNLQSLINISNGIARVNRFFDNGQGIVARMVIDGTDYFANGHILHEVLVVLAKNGVVNATMEFSTPNRAIIIRGNGILGLVMPVMEDNRIAHCTILNRKSADREDVPVSEKLVKKEGRKIKVATPDDDLPFAEGGSLKLLFPEYEYSKVEEVKGKKFKEGGVLYVDEHGKNVVWDNETFFIAVDSPKDARYVTLWKHGVNGKIGVLSSEIANKNSYHGKDGLYLKINKIEIDGKYRGNKLSKLMYQMLLRYSGKDVKGLYSYLPDRKNKKQIPKIYHYFNSEVSGDYDFIEKNKNVGKFDKGGEIEKEITDCTDGCYHNGDSHANGGIAVVLEDVPNKRIEIEGGEISLSADTMNDPKVRTFKGTHREILSQINKTAPDGVSLMSNGKDTKKVKLISGQVIINKKSVADTREYTYTGTNKQIASQINQSDGNGVPIYRKGGRVVKRVLGSKRQK